jgi:hypothetical protein
MVVSSYTYQPKIDYPVFIKQFLFLDDVKAEELDRLSYHNLYILLNLKPSLFSKEYLNKTKDKMPMFAHILKQSNSKLVPIEIIEKLNYQKDFVFLYKDYSLRTFVVFELGNYLRDNISYNIVKSMSELELINLKYNIVSSKKLDLEKNNVLFTQYLKKIKYDDPEKTLNILDTMTNLNELSYTSRMIYIKFLKDIPSDKYRMSIPWQKFLNKLSRRNSVAKS